MATKWYEVVAWKYGAEVNPDFEDAVVEGLSRNKLLFGARYCPCKLDKHPDNICPCRAFREEGLCECGLFI